MRPEPLEEHLAAVELDAHPKGRAGAIPHFVALPGRPEVPYGRVGQGGVCSPWHRSSRSAPVELGANLGRMGAALPGFTVRRHNTSKSSSLRGLAPKLTQSETP